MTDEKPDTAGEKRKGDDRRQPPPEPYTGPERRKSERRETKD